jgi:hypothetical protein
LVGRAVKSGRRVCGLAVAVKDPASLSHSGNGDVTSLLNARDFWTSKAAPIRFRKSCGREDIDAEPRIGAIDAALD